MSATGKKFLRAAVGRWGGRLWVTGLYAEALLGSLGGGLDMLWPVQLLPVGLCGSLDGGHTSIWLAPQAATLRPTPPQPTAQNREPKKMAAAEAAVARKATPAWMAAQLGSSNTTSSSSSSSSLIPPAPRRMATLNVKPLAATRVPAAPQPLQGRPQHPSCKLQRCEMGTPQTLAAHVRDEVP